MSRYTIIRDTKSVVVVNHTKFSLDEIEKMELRKVVKSNWRKRMIKLYRSPEVFDEIISVGQPFGEDKLIICKETSQDWWRELQSPNDIVVTN